MLAGRVKLKNFLIALALAGGGAAAFLAVGMGWMATRPVEAPPPGPSAASAAVQNVGAPAGTASADAVAEVLSHAKDALPVDKVKDISPARSWKINLYQDAGHKTVNRAKLDVDRDDKWDEKYTFFPDGGVSREIAPNDDEQYTVRLLHDGGRWVAEGGGAAPEVAPSAADAGAVPTAGAPIAAPGELAARPVDTEVMTYKGRNLGTDKLKDVSKGKAYKINVYQEAGETSANRAKVDLDRDDKWDEKITFKAGEIVREVAPADDEHYTESWVWTGSGWKKTP